MGSRRQRKMRIVAYFALVATIIGSATAQEFSEAAAEDERTFNGNGNFNNLGGFDFANLFSTVWRKTQQTAGLHRLFPQWVSRCCWRTSSPPATSMDPCSRVSLVLAKFEA